MQFYKSCSKHICYKLLSISRMLYSKDSCADFACNESVYVDIQMKFHLALCFAGLLIKCFHTTAHLVLCKDE